MREVEAGAHCGADPDLARAGAAPRCARARASDLVGEIGGAVGAVVVDDEDVGVGRGGPRPLEELDDVLRLLVGRSHDERTHRRQNLPSHLPRSADVGPDASEASR